AFANGLRKSDVDDLVYEIELHYRSQGFPDVAVAYEHSPQRALITIEEGRRVRVFGVRVLGNRAFPRDDLIELLDLPGPTLGLGKPFFVERDVNRWAESIASRYFEAGFRDVFVSRPEVTRSLDDRGAFLSVRVEEGPQYVLSRIELGEIEAIERSEVESALAYLEGSAWVDRLEHEARGVVLDLYARNGYPFAEVETRSQVPDPPEGASRADVALFIAGKSGPKIRIGRVRIYGESETLESFIRNMSLVEGGDPYRGDRVRGTFRRLWATGLFEEVEVELAEPRGPPEPTVEGEEMRDLVISVVERGTLEYFFEGGFGSWEYVRARAGVRERNILGRGLVGRASILGSMRGGELAAGVSDPWFLGSDWEADLPLSISYREEPSFKIITGSLGLRFTTQLTEDLRFGLAERFSFSRLDDLEVESIFEERPDLRVSAFGPFIELDLRDDVFEPSSGVRLRAYGEVADPYIGSEISFVHTGFTASAYLSPFEGTVFALSAQTDWIIPFSDTETIPIQERIFGGGESSVRSFQQSELGPRDANGEPLGGEVRNLLSAELRQRIWGSFSAAVFVDWGNVAADTSGAFDDFRFAVGPGIRYGLPIGPARFDFAFNPDPRPEEDFFVFQFALGMPY
ncbi:MAG TPA: BamA/TamA family outer membrane protein, partial [Planctomycetota bacterium]|nr:BamA/TamA family outer membrane protein [Planctomycetota bacterium]